MWIAILVVGGSRNAERSVSRGGEAVREGQAEGGTFSDWLVRHNPTTRKTPLDSDAGWLERHKAKMRAEYGEYYPTAAPPESTMGEGRGDDTDSSSVPQSRPHAAGRLAGTQGSETGSDDLLGAAEEDTANGPVVGEASRPENGELLSDLAARGRGILNVHNGTAFDAAVLLEDDSGGAYAKYVRAGARVSLDGVAPGRYTLRFMHGRGWDGDHFTVAPQYSVFDRVLEFEEVNTDDGVRFEELSVTLHAVRGGNARTKSVPPFRLPTRIP